MVTGDTLSRVDGVLGTSAALASRIIPATQDFFVARDQLVDVGTAHMGTRPLSMGVFIQETVIDHGRLARQLDISLGAVSAWVIKACAAAPTKLARAGSAPLAPAAEVIVVRSATAGRPDRRGRQRRGFRSRAGRGRHGPVGGTSKDLCRWRDFPDV